MRPSQTSLALKLEMPFCKDHYNFLDDDQQNIGYLLLYTLPYSWLLLFFTIFVWGPGKTLFSGGNIRGDKKDSSRQYPSI